MEREEDEGEDVRERVGRGEDVRELGRGRRMKGRM